MKLIKRVTAVALSLALLLTGCSSGKELTSKEVQQLLTNDYEVEYIFAMAGLPVDSRHPVKDAAGTPYFPIDSDKYKTTADLKKLLDETYTEATATAILATADADGKPLYVDIEGKLCRSAAALIAGSSTTLSAKDAKSAPEAKDADGNKTVLLTVPELAGETEVGKVTLTAVSTKSGWRLAAGRVMGAATSGEDEQPTDAKGGSFAEAAQQFLDAMVAGDAAKLKELATFADIMGMWDWSQVSFDFLANAGVTAAKVASTVREDARDAEYVVSITATNDSVFPSGTSSYRMTVGVRQDADTLEDSGYYVAELRSESSPRYIPGAQAEPIAVLEQVNRLINLNGMIQFDSPAKLANDVQTEYLLYELSVARPEQSEVGYTLEDIQAMAVRLLGMNSFTPAERFYSEETKSYLMWGRGGTFTNCDLRVIEEANGLVKVEAAIFADPLKLDHASSIIYTLKNNWNGTFELVSGVLVQE